MSDAAETPDGPWDLDIRRRVLVGEDEETVRVDTVSRHLRLRVDQVVTNGKSKTEAFRIGAKASGLSVKAVTIATATPDNEWEFAVARRVLAGEDEETALGGVIQGFLALANPVALIGVIEQDRPIPALTMRYIAAIFEKDSSQISNERVPVVFAIELRRRGKPIPDDGRLLTPGEQDVVKALMAAQKLLACGTSPGDPFWRWLADSLQRSHSKYWFGPSLPPGLAIRLRLEYREKSRGRPREQELSINQTRLGELMARKRARGVQYKVAAFQVREDLKRLAEAEKWEGSLPSKSTIQQAYDLWISEHPQPIRKNSICPK
jgi:hypothetical protein